MAKKKAAVPTVASTTGPEDLAAAKARIRELESKLARQPAAPAGEIEEYPRAMYKKCAVSLKHPHGYEVRRIASAEDQAKLPKGWVESPADL